MAVINGNYKEYKLGNGLVIALQNTPTQTIAAKLRVNYGSSHEREGEEGIAHFLEHCLVSGGSQKYDPIQADELRGSFGLSNAFTNIAKTVFIGGMLTEDLKKWLDYASQHAFYPRFDSERVNGERGRVLREISDKKSNPGYESNIEFNKVFYQNHPKGRFTLGNEDIIMTADVEKIRSFHNRGFHPNNMDLILVGGLPKNTPYLIEQYFGNQPTGENTRKKFPGQKKLADKLIIQKPAKDRLNTENPNQSSAQIFLAYNGPVENSQDSFDIRVLSTILGGDTNSRLFQNLGLKAGLAYNVDSTYNGDYNFGELHVNANVPATRIEEAIESIFNELEVLKNRKVNDKHIERIKKIVRYEAANTIDSNLGHVGAIKTKLDYGLTLEMCMQRFNEVTPDRVLEVANKYLPNRESGKYVLYIRNPLLD